LNHTELGTYAAVIPAYNEAATIRNVVMEVLRHVPHVIVVDDGSTDGTADQLKGLPILLLRNDANQGKAASLWRGFQVAMAEGIEAVITLDGDGQHSPDSIPRMIQGYQQHPGHIIIGSRLHQKENIPVARFRANRFANFWIAWAAGYPISDSQSGFRVYPAELLRTLRVNHNKGHSFVFESEILIVAGRRGIQSTAIPIAAIYPPNARCSHFRPVVDIARITRMVAWKLFSRGMFIGGLLRSLGVIPAHGPARGYNTSHRNLHDVTSGASSSTANSQ
jgi:glycosyltransferase involved in cell wall biosynthesis